MIVRYALSDPDGEIPVGPARAAVPFQISPSESHPFLTLGDYFGALENFLLREKAGPLKRAIRDLQGHGNPRAPIEKILICSEKHGALYHIARVEVHAAGTRSRFALSAALSDQAKTRLAREFDLLTHLATSKDASCLPQVYTLGEVDCSAHGGAVSMVMMLAEWFDDYHEWHFIPGREGAGGRIRLWDMKRGPRTLKRAEGSEIIRQASRILTLHYDMRRFRHITPWHHAAGDFVVKAGKEGIDVRLTTARGYEPIMTFCNEEETNRVMALLTFFLHMTVKMRLDKEEGAGKVIWAEKGMIPAVIQGFFGAIRDREREGGLPFEKGSDFLALLKAFSGDELERLLILLLELYARGDPSELSVIRGNLSSHAADLRQALQDFPG